MKELPLMCLLNNASVYVTNYSAEVWCSVGQWMWIETVVHNVLINKPECVHYDDVVVNEII